MALFRRCEKRASRPMEVLFYRDYMRSGAWELRKKQYYARYAQACKICRATSNVQLNHIRYGNYGHERDRDLVPLCGDHHSRLHERIGVSGDMHYQTVYFLEEEIARHDAEHEERVAEPRYEYSPSPLSAVHTVLDMMARPIWRLFYGVMRW
ncbi:MAG TPA: hypothetical protein VJL57_00205 [Candidatus Paceibacterota bacterium]